MSIAPFPPPPSPWPGRITRDLGTLVLGLAIGFALTFGGGRQLADQISPAPEAEISTEQQLSRGVGAPLEYLGPDALAADTTDDLTVNSHDAIDPADLPIGDS